MVLSRGNTAILGLAYSYASDGHIIAELLSLLALQITISIQVIGIPVVEDQQIAVGERAEEAREAAVAVGEFKSMPPALAFRRVALSLRMLAERLSEARLSDGNPMNISVVLIDTMLWTRFLAGRAGYAAHVDVAGAQNGDVVVVATSTAIEAMARGSLDASVAEAHGLIRLYRQPQSHELQRALLLKATSNEHASDITTADASQKISGQ